VLQQGRAVEGVVVVVVDGVAIAVEVAVVGIAVGIVVVVAAVGIAVGVAVAVVDIVGVVVAVAGIVGVAVAVDETAVAVAGIVVAATAGEAAGFVVVVEGTVERSLNGFPSSSVSSSFLLLSSSFRLPSTSFVLLSLFSSVPSILRWRGEARCRLWLWVKEWVLLRMGARWGEYGKSEAAQQGRLFL